MRGKEQSAANLRVRRARATDTSAAGLVFSSAPEEFTRLAGSPRRARALLRRLWARPGHSTSYEFSWVAEIGEHLAGIAIAFPTRLRYRLHAALIREALPDLPLRRRVLLPLALAWLVAAAPRPPATSFYVAVVAVDRRFLRRRVASSLLDRVGAHARAAGWSRLAGHTGRRHLPMRATLEHFGARPSRERTWGYVLYLLDLGP